MVSLPVLVSAPREDDVECSSTASSSGGLLPGLSAAGLSTASRSSSMSALPAWRDQLRRAARTAADLERMGLRLTDDERAAIARFESDGGLPLQVTPHYRSLIDDDDGADPLRRQVVPRLAELAPSSWDRRDPLGEEELEAVPFLVHRYPDRVLLLATDRCAAYCRFCTRKRMVGQGPTPQAEQLDAAIDYVARHEDIHEVIVSGGDALLLSDERLAALLTRLRAIRHLDVIRIASRMLAFCPQRVTDALPGILRGDTSDGPATYLLSHFNHEKEVDNDAARTAIARLVDGGVPILNQTVLLKGVNDDRDVLVRLFRSLTKNRVRPYYLHQADLAPGTEMFRVPLLQARALYASLRGALSGLSIPTFVVDLPGGAGKVPLYPDPVVAVDDDKITMRSWQGQLVDYPRQ
jgi:lysine 2,3-aminomutase